MSRTLRSVPARWLLLCVPALGVVAMHHAPAEHAGMSSSMTSLHADTPAPDHDSGHSPLRLCLTVLAAAVVLLLGAVLLRLRAAGERSVAPRPGARRVARPPPRSRPGRHLLAAHCVLRI